MTKQELIAFWKIEECASFSGWDFSHLDGRMIDGKLPWNYEKRLREFLKPDTALLDMGTGGGEFLLSLCHPYRLTSVTEGFKPNYELCLKKLAPLGITVDFLADGAPLPYSDGAFNLVINRHESYAIDEVKRVLKKGGHFITQQVGAMNDNDLIHRFCPWAKVENTSFNLENEAEKFRNNGFKVVFANQSYPAAVFRDVGAICYFAKAIPWEFPDFSVDKCLDDLFLLQKEIDKNGFVTALQHRFIIVAKKL